MLLNAAECQGYRFYRFWVIKGKPTGVKTTQDVCNWKSKLQVMVFINQTMDTHREKGLLNKNSALTKSMNIDIYLVGTSNQLFLRSSWTETKYSPKMKLLLTKLLFSW